MTTERIESYFDEAARETLARGFAAWEKIKRHETWADWLAVGEAIACANDQAKIAANGANTGARYNAFMKACYEGGPLAPLSDLDKSIRSKALRCWHEREAITAWRQTKTLPELLKLNHPANVLIKFDASRRPSEREAAPRETQRQAATKLQEDLDAALAKVQQLEREAQDAGTGWDYRTPVPDIARYIRGSMDRRKWNRVRKAVDDLFGGETDV